ncbi:MAG: type II toxin-antitoxin system RelE/ParE family toxin [Candidatus Poribacteria bacterium]|nr:type II toxin-antitoxin system RelE/ParE family toxin [Candidatus Poribacteria bacterium]
MYRLEIRPKAEADFTRLDATVEQRILDKLKALCENCDTHRHEALRGRHRGKFRLRAAGAYRIIYTFNRRTREIIVHEVGHRSSVY